MSGVGLTVRSNVNFVTGMVGCRDRRGGERTGRASGKGGEGWRISEGYKVVSDVGRGWFEMWGRHHVYMGPGRRNCIFETPHPDGRVGWRRAAEKRYQSLIEISGES